MEKSELMCRGRELADALQALEAALIAANVPGPHIQEGGERMSLPLAATLYAHHQLQSGRVPTLEEVRLFLYDTL